MTDSKENYWWDLGSERVKWPQTQLPKHFFILLIHAGDDNIWVIDWKLVLSRKWSVATKSYKSSWWTFFLQSKLQFLSLPEMEFYWTCSKWKNFTCHVTWMMLGKKKKNQSILWLLLTKIWFVVNIQLLVKIHKYFLLFYPVGKLL